MINVGTPDRIALIVTGFVRICPLYAILGIDTCPANRR
ncbi:MAG: DUF2892 domain-containing protein [Pseudomonadota bacterium]